MRAEDKRRAIALRREGWSINEIVQEIGASKGTVSVWLRGIHLTPEQEARLAEKVRYNSVIFGRNNRTLWEGKKADVRDNYIVPHNDPQFMLGLGLYWGEGGKTGSVSMSNSDPGLVKLFMYWIAKFYPGEYADFYLNIHHYNPDIDEQVKEYWSQIVEVPVQDFGKSVFAVSRLSNKKRPQLPMGTAHVKVRGKDIWKIRQKIDKALNEVGYTQPIRLAEG